MQGSLGTGMAWPYYRPESRTLRLSWRAVEFEDAVGGGEHAAREQEERVEQREQEERVGVPDQKGLLARGPLGS